MKMILNNFLNKENYKSLLNLQLVGPLNKNNTNVTNNGFVYATFCNKYNGLKLRRE